MKPPFRHTPMLADLVGYLAICSLFLQAHASELLSRPYKNPIIPGFAPDPSCIRLEAEYYCVTSSFSAFPGIPVYASRDLAQWRQIGKPGLPYTGDAGH